MGWMKIITMKNTTHCKYECCKLCLWINVYFHFKHQINFEYSNRYVPQHKNELTIPNPFSFLLQLIDNLVSGRGVITDKASKHNIKSNIYVPRATVMDSGNYTCISQELKTNSTVKVHVLVDGKLLSLFLQINCVKKIGRNF